MIQRIQSLFLFLCGLGFGGQFMTDFATSNKAIPVLMADSVYEVQDSPVLLGITILGIILPLVAIFLYNNRVLPVSYTHLDVYKRQQEEWMYRHRS